MDTQSRRGRKPPRKPPTRVISFDGKYHGRRGRGKNIYQHIAIALLTDDILGVVKDSEYSVIVTSGFNLDIRVKGVNGWKPISFGQLQKGFKPKR